MSLFLKFEDIPGTSATTDHDEWIEVDNMSFGVSRSVGGSGDDRNTGTSMAQDVSLSKPFDNASADLQREAAIGKNREVAELHFTQSGGEGAEEQVYLAYKFFNVIISSYSISGSGDSHPYESLTLNFTKFTCEYKAFKEGESVEPDSEKGYDMIAQKAI